MVTITGLLGHPTSLVNLQGSALPGLGDWCILFYTGISIVT